MRMCVLKNSQILVSRHMREGEKNLYAKEKAKCLFVIYAIDELYIRKYKRSVPF